MRTAAVLAMLFAAAPARKLADQPTLVVLDAAGFGELRERFNARSAQTRLLVLLSPT